ncbi:MAG: hypothetical protein ABJL35_00065 [Parasphingorhabdus sp.]|uniref:hypothetical protein n=1 Tax=Parasphingorhabdus sp. TaxID=2709688 RepID=UPI00329A3815
MEPQVIDFLSCVVSIRGERNRHVGKNNHYTGVNSCTSFDYLNIGNGIEKVQPFDICEKETRYREPAKKTRSGCGLVEHGEERVLFKQVETVAYKTDDVAAGGEYGVAGVEESFRFE